MAKANTSAKAEPPAATAEPAGQLRQAEGQPQGEQPEEQAPATAGADLAPTQTPGEPVERCDVRVLAAVTIGDTRYQPDEVIEGLPVATAKAHQDSVDPHPDAVAYARSLGAVVHQFE